MIKYIYITDNTIGSRCSLYPLYIYNNIKAYSFMTLPNRSHTLNFSQLWKWRPIARLTFEGCQVFALCFCLPKPTSLIASPWNEYFGKSWSNVFEVKHDYLKCIRVEMSERNQTKTTTTYSVLSVNWHDCIDSKLKLIHHLQFAEII